MKLSQKGTDLIKRAEGFIDRIYKDGGNHFSIGYGTYLQHRPDLYEKYKDGRVISEPEAARLLQEHVNSVSLPTVLSSVKVPLNQNQLDALICLCYNIGNGVFGSSTLVKKLNSGDYQGAANQFLVWNKINGKPHPHLTARREEERKLFLTPTR
jgi:lysozyme